MSISARPNEPARVPATRSQPPALSTTSSPQIDHLFSTLVEAAFDLVVELGTNISLLAYLHVPHDDQPILFVREPALATITATESFRLMHTITMLSNGRKPIAPFRHGALSGHYNRTTGSRSDGLMVFGGLQTAETANRISSISRAFARVLHQFHLDEDDKVDADYVRPNISTEAVGKLVGASVALEIDGMSMFGSAVAPTSEDAVAKAIMELLGPGYRFDEVRRIDVGVRSAVLVVGRDSRQALRLGLAISGGDILHTTALAAQRAVQAS